MEKVQRALLTLLTAFMICIVVFGCHMTAYASSLDDVVNKTQSSNSETSSSNNLSQPQQQPQSQDDYNKSYIDSLQSATNLEAESASVTKVNSYIQKIASVLVQVISYFIIAFLVVRILLDICYIVLPFTRKFLGNGYQGQPSEGQPGMGMGGMGGMGMSSMGGMGMGGMGMGGYGSRYGGMRGMGMGGMQGQGMTSAGHIQLVSEAALNAAAPGNMGADGRPVSALKVYAKDMMTTLVLTPVLLVLAITGVISKLGFLIGFLIAKAASSLGNML